MRQDLPTDGIFTAGGVLASANDTDDGISVDGCRYIDYIISKVLFLQLCYLFLFFFNVERTFYKNISRKTKKIPALYNNH